MFQETQMDKHLQARNAAEDAPEHDRKEDMKNAEEHSQYGQSFIKMLEKFENMWDAHLR